MNNFIEYNLPISTFMGGWYMPDHICDKMIDYFHLNKHLQEFGGVNRKTNPDQILTTEKESLDISIHKLQLNYPIHLYRDYLQQCLQLYLKKYPEVNWYDKFNIVQNYNIQYYPPNGGFKVWHCERSLKNTRDRVLVFMTYLNDVEDGGTEFKYQNLITPAKKGLTLIWPADWTHTHKGQISQNEKYIVTGWYAYE